jgi:hypothetical protein
MANSAKETPPPPLNTYCITSPLSGQYVAWDTFLWEEMIHISTTVETNQVSLNFTTFTIYFCLGRVGRVTGICLRSRLQTASRTNSKHLGKQFIQTRLQIWSRCHQKVSSKKCDTPWIGDVYRRTFEDILLSVRKRRDICEDIPSNYVTKLCRPAWSCINHP